jgi:hypothetical protein
MSDAKSANANFLRVIILMLSLVNIVNAWVWTHHLKEARATLKLMDKQTKLMNEQNAVLARQTALMKQMRQQLEACETTHTVSAAERKPQCLNHTM